MFPELLQSWPDLHKCSAEIVEANVFTNGMPFFSPKSSSKN